MTLEKIGPGQVVFVDADIFICHLTGWSLACRSVLERCEKGEVTGIAGAYVGNEYTSSAPRPAAMRQITAITDCLWWYPGQMSLGTGYLNGLTV